MNATKGLFYCLLFSYFFDSDKALFKKFIVRLKELLLRVTLDKMINLYELFILKGMNICDKLIFLK